MIMIRDIQRETADHFKLPVGAMVGPSRVPHEAGPRQLAMCLSRRLTDHSMRRIGHFFGGRDHSTVWAAIRKTERKLSHDPKCAEAMRQVTLTLLREAGR